MKRIKYYEPIVMLATFSRWLILATITGLIVGTGTSFFLLALYYSLDHTANIYGREAKRNKR